MDFSFLFWLGVSFRLRRQSCYLEKSVQVAISVLSPPLILSVSSSVSVARPLRMPCPVSSVSAGEGCLPRFSLASPKLNVSECFCSAYLPYINASGSVSMYSHCTVTCDGTAVSVYVYIPVCVYVFMQRWNVLEMHSDQGHKCCCQGHLEGRAPAAMYKGVETLCGCCLHPARDVKGYHSVLSTELFAGFKARFASHFKDCT